MNEGEEFFALWQDPTAIYRGAPFWSWNSKLEPHRLCAQIESMHQAGMGGFFMHSRYGLKTPYLSNEWFACVTACVEKARQLDMKAYLYDEDRWPSGPAGGLITRDHEQFRIHLLQRVAAGEENRGDPVASFKLAMEGGRLQSYRPCDAGEADVSFRVITGETVSWHNDGSYLDTLSSEAVAEFIRVTHRAYADRYGKDFGDVIPAIFTDEPNDGTANVRGNDRDRVPWTPELPQEFRRRRGYDLRERLPELFFPLAPGKDFSQVRYDYYRTVTELFVENFTGQIGAWCQKHRLAFTGHVLEEGGIRRQIAQVGACMPHYEHMQWPGIDMLCDNNIELITAKQCTSVASQLGKERVLSEMYGCTGWDWPLEGHKFVGDWQYACGVNFRCQHLLHYSLAGGAKRDYPASIFEHSPWWKHYNVVEDYFARLSLMLTQGKPLRDVLVLHPAESGWGVFGPDSAEAMASLERPLDEIMHLLSGQHYDWDFGDESLLARHAKVSGDSLKVGKMAYRVVIVPPSFTLRGTTVKLLGIQAAGESPAHPRNTKRT